MKIVDRVLNGLSILIAFVWIIDMFELPIINLFFMLFIPLLLIATYIVDHFIKQKRWSYFILCGLFIMGLLILCWVFFTNKQDLGAVFLLWIGIIMLLASIMDVLMLRMIHRLNSDWIPFSVDKVLIVFFVFGIYLSYTHWFHSVSNVNTIAIWAFILILYFIEALITYVIFRVTKSSWSFQNTFNIGFLTLCILYLLGNQAFPFQLGLWSTTLLYLSYLFTKKPLNKIKFI